MSEIIKPEVISRRKALSLLGLAAAFGLAVPPTVLTVSDAEAQYTARDGCPGGCPADRHRAASQAAHSSARAASRAARRSPRAA